MKNKFIQLLALLFLFFTTQAYSNPIDKINFIGLNNTSESTLLEILPFKIGQNFSPYVVIKLLNHFLKPLYSKTLVLLKMKTHLI